MDPLQEEIQAGLGQAFKGSPVDTTGMGFENVIKESIVETKPIESTPSAETTNTLTDNKPDPVDTGSDSAAAKTYKSFEEELAERTEGKFNKWEDVEAIVKTPKEEFASEQVKHWNDLVKKGVNLDKEFFELQEKDFENMDDPLEIRREAMKRHPDYAGLSARSLEFELNKKYNLDEWIDKDDEDLTDEDQHNIELLKRDALKDREWLVDYKNERTFSKTPDPTQLSKKAESERQAQDNWERFVDEELANKTSKLSTKIDDKDTVDFEVSDADKKYAADMMKSMTKDISVFWNQFADKDGKVNQKAVYEMILFNKNKDNIIKIAHQNALAKGKESEVKSIKNVQFEPNASTTSTKVDWRVKALQEAEKHL